ncbi:VENN motif pre-toxin domain-containing protein [Erwinia mallotivora]|uniref:cytidine deaminase-like fold-containing protein n=1 Tax=Erwinia mallotivora TaxID=69222 RepID=UPI0035EE44F2
MLPCTISFSSIFSVPAAKQGSLAVVMQCHNPVWQQCICGPRQPGPGKPAPAPQQAVERSQVESKGNDSGEHAVKMRGRITQESEMRRIRKVPAWLLCLVMFTSACACAGEKSASGKIIPAIKPPQQNLFLTACLHREKSSPTAKRTSDITVQLNGAVIGSTATAEKNKLDTGTLGFSDIKNSAEYEVEHQSVGISTGGGVGGQFLGNLANSLLVGVNGSGSDSSTTKSAVSEGTIIVRDQARQTQDVAQLSRDVENANPGLAEIFDKEREQNRLKEAQLIGEIGSQAADIARTEGAIAATKAAKDKMKDVSPDQLKAAEADWRKANPGKEPTTDDISGQAYQNFYNQAFNDSGLGTGGKVQQAIQAATAVVQGLAGGYIAKAIAGGSAPYIASVIGNSGLDDAGKVLAHAAVNAALAAAQGNNALVGAAGAATAEIVGMIALDAYGKPVSELSESEKQTVSALATLAAGLAGGLAGNSTADAVAAAQAGKTTVENNYLHVSEKTELELAKQKLQNSKDPAEREQAQQQINDLREKDISRDQKVMDACGNGKAASAGCASARVEAHSAKAEYETGQYNNKVSDMYADSYGQIVNLLNITSVDAQNQQQVKDALTQYAMDVLGVDRQTAQGYAETKQGMDIIVASVTPVLGSAAAKQLSKIVDANLKVVAKGNVDGAKFTDTNQTVRPSDLADVNKPTLIDGRIQAKIDKQNKSLPNGNMATAHAEVGVIQQAFEKGMSQGREMTMSVSKEPVCGYCRGDIAAMADKAGLKSLTIYEEATGSVLYWQPGMKSLKVRD